MAKINPIKKMFALAKLEAGMTDLDVASFLGKQRETVCRHINKTPSGWTLGMLKEYKNVLDIDSEDICEAIKEYLDT